VQAVCVAADRPALPHSRLERPLILTQLPADAGSQSKTPASGGMLRADYADRARLVLVFADRAPRVLSDGFHAACDPEISFDAKRILFAGKRAASDRWNVFEMDAAMKAIAHPTPDPRSYQPERQMPKPENATAAKYVGTLACAECHKGPEMGYQFSRWRMSRHATAYSSLSSERGYEIAKEMGVTGSPQMAAECLKCHTTGFDRPAGGFAESHAVARGVGCESCHGPGSEYSPEAVMRDPHAPVHPPQLRPVRRFRRQRRLGRNLQRPRLGRRQRILPGAEVGCVQRTIMQPPQHNTRKHRKMMHSVRCTHPTVSSTMKRPPILSTCVLLLLTTPATADVEEVLIGYFGPSDPDDSQGGDLWRAAQLAVERANRDGGYRGKPFRLVPGWSKDPWGTGVAQVTRMVYDDKVRAIIGGIDGSSTHLAEQVVAKARLTLVSPAATDRSVSTANVPWTFSIAPGDHLLSSVLAAEIARHVGDRPFVSVSADDHDSHLFAMELNKRLAKLRIVPRFHFNCREGTEGTTEIIRRVVESKPAAAVVIAGPTDSAKLVAALREKGFTGTIYGNPAMARKAFLRLCERSEDLVFPLPQEQDRVAPTTIRSPGPGSARASTRPS